MWYRIDDVSEDDICVVEFCRWVIVCNCCCDIDDVWFIVHLNGYIGNAISALRMLQKERLVVSRLGNDIYAFECRSVIDCDCLCDTYSCNDDD